ncbi:MAG: putative rane protein [Deltaproteobacteria bacterium]|nr:putative rane protein [Deltaproteobacteria bacterium]
MSTEYPVHYGIEPPPRFSRTQLLVRVVTFLALGVLGLSFGTVFLFAYLFLPAFAAIRLTSRPDAERYVAEDGPRILGGLRWFAAISAWAGLIAELLPGRTPEETVRLEIDRTTVHPTPGSAMMRLISGIPSAIVLAILCWLGMFVWLWAALTILVSERVGPGAFHYLVGLQRWSIRLLAYQASLVDEYPPFTFADVARPGLPTAQIVGQPTSPDPQHG